jgi:hypothetical protein
MSSANMIVIRDLINKKSQFINRDKRFRNVTAMNAYR